MSHWKNTCRLCRAVSQCRCPGEKAETTKLCDRCEKQVAEASDRINAIQRERDTECEGQHRHDLGGGPYSLGDLMHTAQITGYCHRCGCRVRVSITADVSAPGEAQRMEAKYGHTLKERE